MSSFEQRLMQEIEYREGKVRLASETETEYDTDQPEEKVAATQAYAPQIQQPLKDFCLMEGSDATFVCKVTGRPRPKVRLPFLILFRCNGIVAAHSPPPPKKKKEKKKREKNFCESGY